MANIWVTRNRRDATEKTLKQTPPSPQYLQPVEENRCYGTYMTPPKKPMGCPPSTTKPPGGGGTIIWGEAEQGGGFLKVPRTLVYLGRYDHSLAASLQPRHIQLILVLAARQYRDKPTRAYWEELAADLGAKQHTIRKWAYQLEGLGLLRIIRHKGPARDPVHRAGVRNERNTFDIKPFVRKIKEAHRKRLAERANRKQSKGGDT